MNPEKGQIYIFNDAELSLIKNTFADNDILIYTIRKVLLQFPLTDPEKNLIKISCTPEVISVLKKRIIPDIGPEFPLGQLPSILTTLTDSLKLLTPKEMMPHFAAKDIEITYLNQRFAVLRGEAIENEIMLSELGIIFSDSEQTFINMTAYLFLLGYIDPMLNMMKVIAGTKEETLVDMNNRMKRDSNK